MKRMIVALSVALTSAAVLSAQDVKTTTTIKSGDTKTVVYSGCVQRDETAKGFVLQDAMPLKETKVETDVDKAGMVTTKTTTTTTSFVLVPGDTVDFGSDLGRKVEVTAIAIPRGDDDVKIETKVKTEVKGEGAKEVVTKEKIAQKDWPQLRVVSVKKLNERCQ